jgi:hypothetical protein
MEKFDPRSRRQLIKAATGLAAMALVPLSLVSRSAGAAKLAKADVKYQDRPKAGKDCDDCLQFVPGATAKAAGTCKIVEGRVSPHGYCLAFTPKPAQG